VKPRTVAAIETARVELRADPRLVVHGSRGDHERSSFLLVRVSTSDGGYGYGEVSATPNWSGEDAGSAEHFVRTVLAPALVGEPLDPIEALGARMDRVLARNEFTKAGVNAALWDTLGRTQGKRVVELLGGPHRDAVPVKMSLSGNGEVLERCVEAVRGKGFRSFKVKVGFSPDDDVARFRLARRLVGDDTFLGADANAGWSRSRAAAGLAGLQPYRPDFLEQPVPIDDLEGMGELRGRGTPILADESVFTLADLERAVRLDACDAVSVYVGKAGGLDRAVKMIRVAGCHGVGAILGSNGELGLGAAAQIHVACAAPALGPFPSDIIGHHYYEEDILAEPVPIDGVHARLPEGPGLGVTLDPAIERRFA
jgi:L-alanine-DL-glutamate epimerase-like enolase superfamily enzyme